MKIDVTRKRFSKSPGRRLLNKQNRDKRCYTCGKLEHFSRECTQNKYKNKPSSYDNHGKIIATTKIKSINDHRCLSWTACYDDSCNTHLSDKKDSDWYSKSSRRIKFIAATHRQSKMHDEKNDEESFTMIFDLKDIKKKAKKAFIDTEITKNINRASFQFMYSEIYQLFLQKEADFSRRMQEIKDEIHQIIYESMKENSSDFRQSHKIINYHRIITEWSLTSSKFITTEGYVLPDEKYIFRKLKQKVERLRKEFGFRDLVRYSTQKVNLDKFSYIEKVLQQRENFSSKN